MPLVVNAVKKLQTLRNSRQFRQVYEKGQRFHSSLFSAFILRTESDEQRIGITVTRKIGNAVVRNRCKRRLREALRRHFNESESSFGFDLVINAKPGLIEADFRQIVDGLAKTVGRFGESLLKGK
jgi:ribonuclease P protein component